MDSINGIETAKLIREYDSSVPILIVTSTIQFAMDGYRVNAYRYILKPVEKEGFLTEVRNILDQAGQTTQEYFTVSNESGITKIKMDDIYYFESDVRTINLHTKDMPVSYTHLGTHPLCTPRIYAHPNFSLPLSNGHRFCITVVFHCKPYR